MSNDPKLGVAERKGKSYHNVKMCQFTFLLMI